MKKLLSAVVVIIFGIFFSISSVSAFTLSPSSGTLNNGGQAVISVIAGPSGSTNSVYVHIAVPSGMTVTGFNPLTTGPNIGGCTGSVFFLAQEVCAALGNSTNLTPGQVLGTFTITSSVNGSYDLTAGGDAEYGSGQVVSGTLATYTVSSTGQTLPTTSIFSDENRLLLIGIILVLLGLTVVPLVRFNINLVNGISENLYNFKINRNRSIQEEKQNNFQNKVLRDK